jgi:hypothetical protein
MNGIPTLLKDLRKNRNLTQFQLSQALKIGQATIAGYENGSREPHINSLIAYANFFECSIDYLLGREDDFGNITIQTEKPAPLPQDEQKLLDTYRKLDTVNKMRVSAYAEIRLEEQENRTPSTIRKK